MGQIGSLALWCHGTTRHVIRLQGQTGRLASPALDDDDIVAVVARHICGQSVVLAATFVVVVRQRAPACDTRWPKPCFGHGWAADPIGVSCRYQAKQGGWPFFSTTVRYDCQNSCGQSRLVATRRWPSDGPSLARRMGHWFDIFHKASSLGTLLSYQYSYSRLRLSKLGAIDIAGCQRLSQVSASCAHLETKRTVFHCFEEIMSSPFPVETKIAVFHRFVVASWKKHLAARSWVCVCGRRTRESS